MSPSPQMAPPGSSSYSSDTMSVGDGTWDASRNTFLLPNLVGLNLATTQYNGMGNRFRTLPQYRNLIRAHGVVAAITFLLVIPSAIMIVRFYTRNPRRALRYHIWLQILTVLLATAVFVLGWQAVGPSRSLTNPHHGIGLAIYILIWAQAIGGWWVHRQEKNKRSLYEPLKVMFHHWIGRMIALLGLAQIPLGLTLYGSPLALFVLYALAVFALLVTYFILVHRQDRKGRGGSDYDSRYSYGSGSVVDDRRRRRSSGGFGGNVFKGAIAGLGLYWLLNRIKRRRSGSEDDAQDVIGSRRHSGSYVDDEKYSYYGPGSDRGTNWEDRLLRVAAPIGLAGLLARYLDRRHKDRDSDVGSYGPPLGGAAPINNMYDGRYDGPAGLPPPGAPIPPGQPRPEIQHPLNQPLPPGQPGPPGGRPPVRRPGSVSSSYTSSSFESASGQPRRNHGLRDGLATLGAVGLAREFWNKRKGGKEDQRLKQEQEARAHGNRLTGDGRPPPRRHPPAESTLSTDTSSIGNHPAHGQGIPPVPAGMYPAATAAGTAPPGIAPPPNRRDRNPAEELPLGGIPRTGQVQMPDIPPDRHGGLFHGDSSGSEVYIGEDGRNHWRHHARGNTAAAAAAGGAANLAAAETGHRRRRSHSRPRSQVSSPAAEASTRRSTRRQSASGEESRADSTPVSVKVKMHNDGRHVTLRRLPEAEAAAEREARRERAGQQRRQQGGNDSVSSLSGTNGSTDRFRRNQLAERQQAEAMRIESERLAAAKAQAQAQGNPNMYPNVPVPVSAPNVPAPPPIPESSSNLRPPGSGVGSPATYDGNTTEASADYANNRRRRRAERSQAKLAREQRRVEFE